MNEYIVKIRVYYELSKMDRYGDNYLLLLAIIPLKLFVQFFLIRQIPESTL